jgi:hypothetical protein
VNQAVAVNASSDGAVLLSRLAQAEPVGSQIGIQRAVKKAHAPRHACHIMTPSPPSALH